MTSRLLVVTTLVLVSLGVDLSAHAEEPGDGITVAASDWPWWRGPTRDGVADANQAPPLHWSEEENVLWKSPVPGRGHGSPTVVGDRVFLATADEAEEIQSVLCYDRKTGAQLWKTDVHKGGFASSGRPGHPRSTKASSTVASDGHSVFINFINNNAVYTTALSLDGAQRWQQKVSDYIIHQGYGSSPAIYGSLVIASADNKGGGAIAAFNRETGDVAWTVKRRELPNYTSPMILKVDGRDQLILSGHEYVSSFAPLTGELNWEAAGATLECVTSVVTDGEHIVTSGGYPSKHISVMRGDGSGEVIWRNTAQVYVPSMVVHDGHFYGVTDSGEAFCYAMESETPLWEQRLRAGCAASAVLVGDNIYVTSEKGTTFIFKAKPGAFELVAENTIAADDIQATPAICGGRIYMRLAREDGGKHQEMLYCIGTPD